MMWRTIAVALLLAHVVLAVDFSNTLGTIADRCQNDLLSRAETNTNENCVRAGIPNVGPASSHLIILPSQNPAIGTNIVTTIVGRGFLALGAVNQGLNFRLGNPTNDPAEYCRSIGVNPNVGVGSPLAAGRVDSDTQITINIPLGSWANQAIELEFFPRPICLQILGLPAVTAVFPNLATGFLWTGFLSGASYDCNFNDRLCTSRDITSIPGLSAVRRAELATRNTCCRNVSPRAIFVETTPTGFAGTAFNLTVGSCINPNVQTCCGAVPVTQQTEKCCNVALQTTAFVDGFCPCRVSSDCAAPQTTLAGLENTCCRNQRPINIVGEAVDTQFFGGQCFNPANTRCCATGEAYDPGAQQCCPVNGLQSLNLPCPCNVDTDCAGIADNNARCCRQSTPNLLQQTQAVCNAFTNYAQGVSIPPQATRCLGTCYDSRFGVCCNGATCLREIENCCNNTCCNRFTQGCFRARGSGVPGFAGNNAGFDVIFARCSAIEYLDSVRVFWFAVLPALLLLASFLALALALVFVNKASARRTSFLELALIVVAVITFMFALPLYFAPVYKYGIVTAFACIVAILAAGVRVRWLNGFAIILLAIAVIYVIDPFFGNAWLTLTSDRVHFGGTNNNGGFANPFIVGTADVRTSGVLHASNFLFKDREATVSPLLRRCVRFYNYFSIDPNLVDYSRIDNPEIQTFGYCSRAWIIGQIYIEGLLILFLLVTFILAVLALIVRFRKLRFEPIELEVRDVAPGVVY